MDTSYLTVLLIAFNKLHFRSWFVKDVFMHVWADFLFVWHFKCFQKFLKSFKMLCLFHHYKVNMKCHLQPIIFALCDIFMWNSLCILYDLWPLMLFRAYHICCFFSGNHTHHPKTQNNPIKTRWIKVAVDAGCVLYSKCV